jgi:hypothetical protein
MKNTDMKNRRIFCKTFKVKSHQIAFTRTVDDDGVWGLQAVSIIDNKTVVYELIHDESDLDYVFDTLTITHARDIFKQMSEEIETGDVEGRDEDN